MSESDLRLEANETKRTNGSWRVRWRVTNPGTDHVRLIAVQAPHRRFRADSVDLDVVVPASVYVEQTLRIEAAPGEEIENAFVIFVVEKDHETWRMLFRVRVRIGADGTPSPVVETSSTHRVGFSEPQALGDGAEPARSQRHEPDGC